MPNFLISIGVIDILHSEQFFCSDSSDFFTFAVAELIAFCFDDLPVEGTAAE